MKVALSGNPEEVLKVFGITGGIGSGKSTLSSLVREAGVPVVDADVLSKLATGPRGLALPGIVQEFTQEALGQDGGMDRKKMAAIVFSNKDARRKLNEIVHPVVRKMAEDAFAEFRQNGVPLAAYDVPLLFEAGLQNDFRPTVVVVVDKAEQVARVMRRDKLSREEAIARIDAQMPLAEKVALADFVVENQGTKEELRGKVEALLRDVRQFLGE